MATPLRSAFWKLIAGLAIVVATALVKGTVPAFADSDLGANNNSNPYTGYWQICTEGGCYDESINYTFSGYWGADLWNCGHVPPCRYQYFFDYENSSSISEVVAYGAALNGQCCPDAEVSIEPDGYVVECWHNRSDCGEQTVEYRMKYDSHRQGAAVTCSQDDYCRGWAVPNEEQEGFIDPAMFTSACEVSVGQATPHGGTCGRLGYTWDVGQ